MQIQVGCVSSIRESRSTIQMDRKRRYLALVVVAKTCRDRCLTEELKSWREVPDTPRRLFAIIAAFGRKPGSHRSGTGSGEAESLPLHEEVKTSVSQAHPPTALVDFCVYANTAFCRNTWRYLKSERHGCGDAPMCSDALGAFLLPVFRLSHAKGFGRVQGKGRAFFCIGIPWRQVRAIGG